MEQATLALAQQLLRDTIAFSDRHAAHPEQCCMWTDGRVQVQRLEAIWLLHNNPKIVRDIYRDESGGLWRCVGQPEAFRVTDEGRAWPKAALTQAAMLCRTLREDTHSGSDGKAYVPCSAEDVEHIIIQAAPEVASTLGDTLQEHAERAAERLARRSA